MRPAAAFLARSAVRPSCTLLLLCAALLAGCGTGTDTRPLATPDLARLAAERGLDPAEVLHPFEPTPEMRLWLEDRVTPRQDAEEQLDELLTKLLSPRGLGLVYEAGYSATAAEAFAARKANCLGFTNLFVALGRELGVPVYFLAVDEVETFAKGEDLVVVSRHVTAGYGVRNDVKVLEFSSSSDIGYNLVRRVSDATAVALYYSNRGAEMVQAGDAVAALDQLAIATRLDPELAMGWVNLGVARRRTGDLDGAEAAYRRALELDPRAPSAYQNLAALLRHRGRAEEAETLARRLAETGSRNPYNFLSLGDHALRRGELEQAGQFYRRALRLQREDAETYAALGLWAVAVGDRDEARRLLAKARGFDPDHPRVRELARRLS
ncbi:MAG TPA: tetratricopeptide repeat protein [Thermoanaerobaculia bacterium]|nr:tetratricopeptide repeat protein [Thermoanaerobaculia bacterium]